MAEVITYTFQDFENTLMSKGVDGLSKNKNKEANDLLKLRESIALQGKLIEDQKKEFRKREEVFKKREEDFKRREEESRRKHLEEIKNLKATILQDLKKEMPRETSTRSGNQYSKGLHHLV
jgi:hypothetical protein